MLGGKREKKETGPREFLVLRNKMYTSVLATGKEGRGREEEGVGGIFLVTGALAISARQQKKRKVRKGKREGKKALTSLRRISYRGALEKGERGGRRGRGGKIPALLSNVCL